MKKFKQFLSRPIVIALLFVMALGLLLGTGIEGTRAVLNETSSPFHATMNVSSIDVALLENKDPVAENGYNKNSPEGELKLPAVKADKKLKLGYAYPEQIAVQNIGSIPQFVRVTITKYWTDEQGKRVDLKPEYIELEGLGAGWMKDPDASTPEREVYYYSSVLAPNVSTTNLTETIRIHPDVMKHKSDTAYDYDDLKFHLEAKVDTVQNRHAEEAIKSAWGVSVSGDENAIALD